MQQDLLAQLDLPDQIGFDGLDGANSQDYEYDTSAFPLASPNNGKVQLATNTQTPGGLNAVKITRDNPNGVNLSEWFNTLLTHVMTNDCTAIGTIMNQSDNNIFETGTITYVAIQTVIPTDEVYYDISWTTIGSDGTFLDTDDVMFSWVLNGCEGPTGHTGPTGHGFSDLSGANPQMAYFNTPTTLYGTPDAVTSIATNQILFGGATIGTAAESKLCLFQMMTQTKDYFLQGLLLFLFTNGPFAAVGPGTAISAGGSLRY